MPEERQTLGQLENETEKWISSSLCYPYQVIKPVPLVGLFYELISIDNLNLLIISILRSIYSVFRVYR